MSATPLEAILNNSNGEVECFLDPEDEIFFGPITEREREIRKPLPRKTLHPCEIAEISKRGMNFHQWEDYKAQFQRNEMNDKAIQEVYGLDAADSTEESFTSCVTAGEEGTRQLPSTVESFDQSWNEQSSSLESSTEKSRQEVSGVGSLNDTWEIQERMLALAEKLERGEEIPELGITHHPSGFVEYTDRASNNSRATDSIQSSNQARVSSNSQLQPDLSGACVSVSGDNNEVAVDDTEQTRGSEEIKTTSTDLIKPEVKEIDDRETICDVVSDVSVRAIRIQQRKTPSVEELAKEMGCLFLAQSISETPVKSPKPKTTIRKTPSSVKGPSCSRVILETPIKTPTGFGTRHRSTPIPTSSLKPVTRKTIGSKNVLPTASPVGMYIRSLPEPMLIKNVRATQKKKQIQNIPMASPASVAVKNKAGRWSVARTPRSSFNSESKENCPQLATDFKAVLPTVLHEAAATLIDEKHIASPHNAPGTQGKIGKLLERGVTPTVMKHQGLCVWISTFGPKQSVMYYVDFQLSTV